jgi:ABC-type multidrug transport system fused ATPase/permease subunit
VGISKNFIEDLPDRLEISEDVLCFVEASNFRWPIHQLGADKSDVDVAEADDGYILHEISLKLKRGEITGLCGEVGSGKSSLALAILQEMELSGGTCAIRKDIKTAYCSQIPWIIQGSIEENILFGAPLQKEWLDKVISVCQLDRDVASFSDGLYCFISLIT